MRTAFAFYLLVLFWITGRLSLIVSVVSILFFCCFAFWLFILVFWVAGLSMWIKLTIIKLQLSIGFSLKSSLHSIPLNNSKDNNKSEFEHPPLKQALLHKSFLLVFLSLFAPLDFLEFNKLFGDINDVFYLCFHHCYFLLFDSLVNLWHFVVFWNKVSICLITHQYFSSVPECWINRFCLVGRNGNASLVDRF